MKNIFLILLSSILLSAPVLQDDAIKVAKNVIFEFYKIPPSDLIIDDIIKIGSQKTKLYIINFSPNGFAIISADDRVFPILAYSVDNKMNFENIPMQLLEVIDSWQEGIEYIINNNINASISIEAEWEK